MILRFAYNCLYTLILPLVFLRLWFRGFKLPAYRLRWAERLGCAPLPRYEQVVWVHAVSVGELLSAIPLIQRIRKQSQSSVFITTTTPTGSERVKAAFKDDLGKTVYHSYFPFDLLWIWRIFFQRVQPRVLYLIEGECWPNLLHCCQQKKIPIVLVNARLSPRSAKRYQRFNKVAQYLFAPVSHILAQSHLDQERFLQLGLRAQQVICCGNIKCDLNVPKYLGGEAHVLRERLGAKRWIFIAASTHEGEEQAVLAALKQVKSKIPQVLCLLVPRHPERFDKVAKLCQDDGFRVIRRSSNQEVTPNADIFLGDSMGELLLFYAASDCAFVGGSFVPVGGHNLLEPAALKLPIITGPLLDNFMVVRDQLLENNALQIVHNAHELAEQLLQFYQQAETAVAYGERGFSVVEQNRGALERQWAYVKEYL